MFIIQSSIDGHLDCFHFLAIVNRTAMKMVEEVSVECMPRSGIAMSFVNRLLAFLEFFVLISKVTAPVLNSTNSCFLDLSHFE